MPPKRCSMRMLAVHQIRPTLASSRNLATFSACVIVVTHKLERLASREIADRSPVATSLRGTKKDDADDVGHDGFMQPLK